MNMQSVLTNTATDLADIKNTLISDGWILLRNEGYTLDRFSGLMNQLCRNLTFDPARQYSSRETQKVDAGTGAVGLHIENGNTPLPPDIVAFHSALSARKGSQTTVCDGAEVYRNLEPGLHALFKQPMTVSRYLPKQVWQRYVATAFAMDDPELVTRSDLERFVERVPGQQVSDAEQGGINYTLTILPVRQDNLRGVLAFANAILGPSYNYEPPVYRYMDGSIMDSGVQHELAALCEQFTQEVAWQDGDVVVIDNKRFMHGRREILVPLEERKLYIGMGSGLNI